MPPKNSTTSEQKAIGTNPEEAASPPIVDDEQPFDENAFSEQEKLKISAADAHMRRGLQDPSPSVRATFRAALANTAVPKGDEGPYRGPFIVRHRFRYVDANGAAAEMDHLMPLPSGEHVSRILNQGDIPDDVAQSMWAEGAIDMAPRKPPSPRPRPRTIASPTPNHFR